MTHVKATIEHSKLESGQNVVEYLDDAYVKLSDFLWKQGCLEEAETLQIEVVDTRSRVLGVKHQDTIDAMRNLAKIFGSLGKYREGKELEIQVQNLRYRIFEEECPHPIMANPGVTYLSLENYTEAENQNI